MTRFITFRDVVMNADEIQYLIIEPATSKIRKRLGWKEADWAVRVVIGKEDDSVAFAYATREHAREAVSMIYNLLTPPASITEGVK